MINLNDIVIHLNLLSKKNIEHLRLFLNEEKIMYATELLNYKNSYLTINKCKEE